jgi:DNA-binding XRE family transcriptional regulator/mannose-6-phosphate isomerase-like protein (cupin superfamily)
MVRAVATKRAAASEPSIAASQTAVGQSVSLSAVDDIVSEIGPKVRALRTELGLSLQQMGALAEVSAASIHKIERGEMVPTITTLLKLAAAFRRPVSYLINENPGDPDDTCFTPRGSGSTTPLDAGDGEIRIISGPSVRFRAEATISKIPAGFSQSDAAARPGEELLFVLAGSVQVEVDQKSFAMRKGDALHYLTDRALQWSTQGKQPAELLRIKLPYS